MSARLREIWLPALVLAGGLGLTGALAWLAWRDAGAEAQRRFEAAAEETEARIGTRMQAYVAILRGTAALLSATSRMDRDTFAAYVERLRVPEFYPGVQGIGYSRRTGDTHAIVMLEPLDRRNQAAIGYDMFTEPVRRAAMERARDGSVAAMSGRVTLVQEIDEQKQPGFLIYVPVYEGGKVPRSVEERRALLLGFAYSPFRAHDLFSGIFGRAGPSEVDVAVHDGSGSGPDSLLYRSPGSGARAPQPGYLVRKPFELLGHGWTLTVSSRPQFDARFGGRSLVAAIAAGGAALSLLLSALVWRESLSRLALRESEARKSVIIESAIDCLITADARGRITEFNPAAERTFGFARAQVLGRALVDTLIPPHLRDAHSGGLERYLRTGEGPVLGRRLEVEAMRADGTLFPLELGITASTFHGEPVFTAHARDITDRKRAERTLRESEARFRVLADSAPVLVWMAGTDKRCVFFNRPWLEFTGRTIEQELGNGWAEGVHAEDLPRCLDTYVEAFDARRAFVMQYRLRRHDGEYRWISDNGIPRFDARGEFLGYIGSCIDVTEMRLQQSAVEAALREKELMLGEIHHRVKNNLQVIHSVLDLQVMRIADARVREMLRDTQNRVRSMSLIHQTLYQSKNFGEVDFQYFLGSLLPVLVESYAVGPEQVAVHVDAEKVRLPIDAAIPCGLVVNELVANAFRHAFPDGRPGNLWVGLRRLDGVVELSVANDGMALPENFDAQHATTLGLHMVRLLAEQIGADLAVQPAGPTRFSLRFAARRV
jgi:PAS domain S-box-containing protein